MSDNPDKPKPIAGELIAPKQTGSAVTSRKVSRPKPISSFMDILTSYADQRRWEADTKRKNAVADNINAQSKIAIATENWLAMEERLNNLDNIKSTVSTTINAELKEMEVRLANANRELKLAEKTEEAEALELDIRILESKVKQKRLMAKLEGTEEDIDELIKKAEAEINANLEEAKNLKEKNDDLTVEEQNAFSRKHASIADRLANLEERRARRDAEAGE